MNQSMITSSRVVNFSIELIYAAWSDPAHLKKWWGPAGFSNTFHEFDFRVGGTWRFTMHGPERGHYENHCEFTDIKEGHVIAWKRISKPLFNVLVTFEDLPGSRTKVDFNMIFHTPEECAKLRPFVIDKNEENFDRMEHELQSMRANTSMF